MAAVTSSGGNGNNQQQVVQEANNEIHCDAPPVLSVPWNGQIDLSLDGTVYTGSALPVKFFGPPHGIVMRTQEVTVVSAPVTYLPDMLCAVVDAVGQTVSANVLQIPVFAETFVSSFKPDADAASGTSSTVKLQGPTSQIVNLQAISVNSPATITFSGLYVQLPASGILTLGVRLRPTEQSSALRFDYRTSIRVSVTPGSLARIAIVRQPSPQIDSLGKLSQEPLIAPVDQAGNKINLNSFDGIIFGVALIERPLPKVSTLPQSLLDSFQKLENRNQTVVCARGGCDLGTLDPINSRAGFTYSYYIWEVARPHVSLETRVMEPSCNAGSFRRLGSYVCEPCIPNTKCLASGEMVVDPGYWRPSEFALNVYSCFPAEACPGGNASAACAEGYSGPRCSVCVPGRGKSVTDRCQSCGVFSKVQFVMSLIVVSTAIIFFVIYVVQNWDDPDRHVTTLQLALTQMQLLVAMTDLEFDYPPWYRQTQSWVALFSDLRIFESANADCTLRPEGATFFTRFVTYVCTPLMALLVAGIAWIILYLNPMLFRYSQALEAGKRRKRTSGGEEGGTNFKSVGETLPARLERRWHKKQHAEHKTEEHEIRLALKNLLAGSDDEDEETIENAKLVAQLAGPGAAPKVKSANMPMPRTGITFLMLTAQQVILFFMYPSTVQYSLSMQDCLEVSDGTGSTVSYLKVDPTISCTTDTYLGFKFTALIFGIGMLLGVPCVYIVTHYVHRRLRASRRRERAQIFSFLMQGIRPRRWYYPALIFLRKGLSTAIVAFIRAPLDAYFTMWGLVFYLPAVYYLKPYLRTHHNLLEALAVSATIVAINLSLIIYAVPDNKTVSTLCSAVIVVMMACILLLFAYISTAKTRYIAWGRLRSFWGHITSSESEDEVDFEAEKKALAEPLLTHGDGDGSSKNNINNATGTGPGAELDMYGGASSDGAFYSGFNRSEKGSRASAAGKAKGITIEQMEAAEQADRDAVDATTQFAESRAAEREEQRRRTMQHESKTQTMKKHGNVGSSKADGRGDTDSDIEIVDASGPESSLLLLEDRKKRQQQQNKPSAEAAATSASGGKDDNSVSSWTAPTGTSSSFSAVVGSPRRPMAIKPVFSDNKVQAHIEQAQKLAAERQVRQSYSHIGDHDEVVRFKRKAPEVHNHAEREEMLRRDILAKQEQRKQEREQARQKRLESSPFVYVPKVAAEDSVVSGLSSAQRLEILSAPHIDIADLVHNREKYTEGGNSVGAAPAAAAAAAAAAAGGGEGSILQQRAKEKEAADKAPPRDFISTRHDTAQQVLERCFQPKFDVKTNQLDVVVKSGMEERRKHEQQLDRLRKVTAAIGPQFGNKLSEEEKQDL